MKRVRLTNFVGQTDRPVLPGVILSAILLATIIVHMDILLGSIRPNAVVLIFPEERIQIERADPIPIEDTADWPETVSADHAVNKGGDAVSSVISYRFC